MKPYFGDLKVSNTRVTDDIYSGDLLVHAGN